MLEEEAAGYLRRRYACVSLVAGSNATPVHSRAHHLDYGQ